MLLTQTNWLRMPPARAPQSSFETPNGAHGVGSTLLKRHKVLPHPRPEPAPEFYPSPPRPTKKPQVLSIDTDVSSTPGSDTSSPRTLKHTSRRIGALPPTPPTHSRQSSGGYPAVPSAPRYDVKLLASPAEISSIPSTPTNQRSPPTPDVTPPRGMPLAFRPPMRPAAHERYPSSTTRTDSFKTAREQQSSSGDEDEDVSTVRPLFSSARASDMTIVPQLPEKSSKRKEIGLGLGLESEGTTTPRQRTKSPQDEFVVFDGEWASTPGEVSEVEREWDDNLMRNVTVRKRQPRGSLNMTADGAADEVVEKDIVSPTNATRVVRGLPLQQRIAKHRLERNSADRTSTEKFAKDISWPPAVADPESPTTPDAKRFSTMSGRSGISTVVVDAMVVDAAPSRRKTLRHTKKQLGLRDFGSDQSTLSSAPNSVASSEPPRLLHHKKAEIPQRRHQSLASNTTVSTNSSLAKSRRQVIKDGGIPVVIIPDRKSSSKSSNTPSLRSTSSRKTKRSMSLNSAPLSQSAKFNDPGYFNPLSHHNRTLSESAGSSSTDQRTIDFPPQIPTRRSSLSAPTSRNVSRAGSLTAESLKAHNMQQQAQKQQIDQALQKAAAEPVQKAEPPQSLPHSSPGLTRGSIKSNFDHNGDPFFGNRLSAQATPFSQSSYDTAGTAAEVSEAMVVSLYPHQNKSLLVVQHENSSPVETSSKSLQTLEIPRSQPTMAQPTMAINNQPTTGPVTPPQPAHPMDKVDSPLRNPRVPPEPPAIKFIPPTPAGLTPGQEEERQLGYDPNDDRPATSDSKPKRGLSLVRKALGNRRFSESGVSGAGLLRRTFSHSGKKSSVDESTQTAKGEANPNTLYPTVDDRPPDGTKLHPFWRPAHFWDDLEGHDDEDSGDDEFGHVYPVIDNRPAPPKRGISGTLKRTFAILPIQDDDRYEREPHRADRRTVHRTASGNMRVVKQRSNSSMRRGASSPPTSRYRAPSKGEFGYGFQDGNGGKRGGGYNIPGLGVKVEYVGWGAMRRRLSERRREQRSEKLRGSISSPRGVQNGTDDVLRQRNRA